MDDKNISVATVLDFSSRVIKLAYSKLSQFPKMGYIVASFTAAMEQLYSCNPGRTKTVIFLS